MNNSIEELFRAAENGEGEKAERLERQMKEMLSEEQRQKLDRAFSDPDYLRSLLSSQKAKDVIGELKKRGLG